MSDPHPEQLLGYLLNALEGPERELLDQRLEKDPELRGRLAQVRRSLEPLAAARREFRPPRGLATRTCQFVAASSRQQAAGSRQLAASSQQRVSDGDLLPAARCPLPAAAAERSGRWRWQDVAVAATVLVGATMLIVPAIHSSRFNARVTACQDNLRELGLSLGRYSQANRGYFPRVPAQGPLAVAGIYAPSLLSGGFLTDDRRVICPGSALAGRSGFSVPSLAKLESASQDELARILPDLGGGYGYGMGYTEDGEYHDNRDLGRSGYALMADAPSTDRPGHQTDNHGGRGQNVLFEDMHVRFLTTPRPADLGDDVFVNERGVVAAGTHRDDAVIAPSTSTPVLCGSGL